jgi:adenosylcobinamide-GDP ribazoletransferase
MRMSLRGARFAVQFLTRLPVGASPDFSPADLSRSSAWFPAVGLLVGACAAAALLAGARIDPWLGALFGALVWVGITGALHLDGLADLADALGAAHRGPARFLDVLRDPHVGAFGVIALVLAIVAKLILLNLAVRRLDALETLSALALAAAWARYGALVWSAWLPPLAAGSAERFAWRKSPTALAGWAAALTGASIVFAPGALCGALGVASWGLWLKRKLGGVTGDCLGAGVEVVELVVLLAVILVA